LRNTKERAALFLIIEIPQFFTDSNICQQTNTAIEKVIENMRQYLKNNFMEQFGYHNIRYPINGHIQIKIRRMDPTLLSIELIMTATQHAQVLLQKHIYLHFTENGSLPIGSKELTEKKVACLLVRGNTATNPNTGACYALKKKYHLPS